MAGPRPIPKDATAALTAEALANCRNLGLLLDRLNPWKRVKGKWDLSGEAKRGWLSDLCQGQIDTALLDAYRVRWEQLVAHHGAHEKSGLRLDMRTESRLVVGLGADSVLETAITLHRIYGFPIIPGSALKGLTRAWALLELAAALGVPVLDYEQFQAYKGSDVKNKTPLNRLEALLEANLDTDDEEQQKALRGDLDALKREQPVQDAGGDILAMGLADFKSHQ
jgi:hypothetical protein